MENQDEFKFRTHIIKYLNLVIQGLIAFAIVGIGLGLLLAGYFKMRYVFVLPIVFICSIIISPFLSRIKLGEKLLIKFEKSLSKLFKLK
jgi:hypothetical protein